MVLILLVDVIRIGVRISGVSLNGCFVGSVPDDEYIDEVSLIGTLPECQPSLAGKRLSLEPADRGRSPERVGICARSHDGKCYVDVLRQSIQRALESILIVLSSELVETDVQVAPVVGDDGLRV